MTEIKKEYMQWKKDQEQGKVNFKEIMEQLKKTAEENLTKEVHLLVLFLEM